MDLLFVWKLWAATTKKKNRAVSWKLQKKRQKSGLQGEVGKSMPGEKELQEQQEEKSGLYFAWRSIIPGQRPRPADLSDVCAKKRKNITEHAISFCVLSARNIFESENSVYFTFNVSLGRECSEES